jgi:hypothetical protein
LYLEFINNEKIEEYDETDDDVYTMDVKRLAIKEL